ncbi:MAG: hypothetical protein NVS4B3_15260 [Gemmatimonadaceae bacterium]
MTKRMAAAFLALVGLFISLYLTLYKLGVVDALACAVGSCETVQLSRWSTLFGLPVAAWGVGFYLITLAVAVLGVQPRWEHSRRFALLLVLLTGWGVVFSAWLTGVELFVIRAICQWCVASASIVMVLFAVSVADWLEVRRPAGDRPVPTAGGSASLHVTPPSPSDGGGRPHADAPLA